MITDLSFKQSDQEYKKFDPNCNAQEHKARPLPLLGGEWDDEHKHDDHHRGSLLPHRLVLDRHHHRDQPSQGADPDPDYLIMILHQATSAANSRKISRSSTNQLIHEALGEDECSVSLLIQVVRLF